MEPWKIVRQIARGVLRRRKALTLVAFVGALAVLAPVAYYFSAEAPRYRASATILLETRPDRIPLFQEFSPFRPLSVQLAILNSRSLAEAVLQSLPRSSVEELARNAYEVDLRQRALAWYARLRGQEPEVESPQRRSLRELQRSRVQFKPSGRTGIVTISADASRPQVAIDIVNTYVEVLLARTRSFNLDDARVSREFLEQQVADVKTSLQQSEEALRAFTMGRGGIRLPDQSQAAMTRLGQTETALAEASANRKILETRLAAMREKAAVQRRDTSAPAPPPAPRAIPPQVQRVRDQLAKLENTLIELRTRYTDEHPRVVLVREQIADLQRELGSAVKEASLPTPAASAIPQVERISFAEQVVALETSLHAVVAQEQALRSQADALRQSLQGLSRGELEYSRLNREVERDRSLLAVLSDRLTAARIREQGEMKVVKVIDPPGPPVAASNEKRVKFGGVALVLASVIGLGVPSLVEWIKRPVESEDDVESSTALPVLAVVPKVRAQRPVLLSARERRELADKGGAKELLLFTEAFRNLRVAIQLASRAEPLRSILVTSAFPGEGKSTVLMNLGLELAESGQRVVLAETDFVRPTLHRSLKVRQDGGGGLVAVLHEAGALSEALVPVSPEGRLVLAMRGSNLRPETRGLLATRRLHDVVGEMTDRGDFVLCDSAPALLVPDNVFLATAVDGVILVARAGKTGCRELTRAKQILEGAGARILGVVINEMPMTQLRRYYRRYYKGYEPGPALKEAS